MGPARSHSLCIITRKSFDPRTLAPDPEKQEINSTPLPDPALFQYPRIFFPDDLIYDTLTTANTERGGPFNDKTLPTPSRDPLHIQRRERAPGERKLINSFRLVTISSEE
jgi:hypothetical protein